ncbi:MAG TPA: DUF2127 domain-containing protein [Terracidiphilus sp.]|nr:DUF2127 domain-containing protein [Terracidiphilus sp.]
MLSLLPIEICEIFWHPTIIKIPILLINVAVVTYLTYRIKLERLERRPPGCKPVTQARRSQ